MLQGPVVWNYTSSHLAKAQEKGEQIHNLQ